MTPILVSGDEATKLIDAQVKGEKYEPKQIKEVPLRFQKWVEENNDRINVANNRGTLPYWIGDNKTLLDTQLKESKAISKRINRTQDDIDNIQRRWDERKLYNKISNIEDNIRMNKGFETAVVFDKYGNIIIDKRGKATSVSFTNEECKLVKDCIFTHNHPRGWSAKDGTLGRIGNSFSSEDISFAIANDVAEIRAVTPTYTFSMKRPANGWKMDVMKFKREYAKLNKEVENEMDSLINKSQGEQRNTAIDRARATYFHLVWKRFAKQHGIEYSKTKSAQ
jgi:hypothetical protein